MDYVSFRLDQAIIFGITNIITDDPCIKENFNQNNLNPFQPNVIRMAQKQDQLYITTTTGTSILAPLNADSSENKEFLPILRKCLSSATKE